MLAFHVVPSKGDIVSARVCVLALVACFLCALGTGCGPRIIRADGGVAPDDEQCVAGAVKVGDGAVVDFIRAGHGPDVVQIPGAEDGMTLLRDRAAEACEKLLFRRGVRTTVLSRRVPLEDGDPARLAIDVVDALDHLGLREPVVVEGISAGGPIALHVALAQPARVRGLILATTFAGFDGPGRAHAERWRDWARERDFAALYRDMIETTTPPSVRWLSFLTPLLPAPREPDRFVALIDGLLRAPDITPRLGEIKARTLLVTGERDELVPATLSAALAKIDGAHSVVIEGFGHDATSTRRYANIVMDFAKTE